VNEPGVVGDTRPMGLGDLGVSKSVVSADDRESVATIWSPKWALNKVETGRSRKAGNSETLAGALCGCCSTSQGFPEALRMA